MHVARPPLNIEVVTFRMLCLLVGLGIPLMGYAVEVSNPGLVDPLWLRLAVAALPMGVLIASYFFESVRREIAGLVSISMVVVLLWFVSIATINELAVEYAVGAMVCLIAVGVVVSAGFSKVWMVASALAASILLLVAVAALIPDPTVDRAVFIGSVLVGGATMFVGAWLNSRLRMRLSRSELRYRTVFERVADGVVLVAVDGLKVVASNAAYRNFTGFTRQELRAKTLYDVLDLRRDDIDRDVQAVMQNSRVDLDRRRQLKRDGTFVDTQIGLARIPDPGGDLVCLTVRDLSKATAAQTQMLVAEQQAEATQQLRTVFLDNMSHELRTPLVSLTGFLDLLENDDDGLDPRDRREMLQSLRRSADRLNQTLNAVLDLAQIEGGHIEISPEPIEMNRAAEEALTLLQAMAHEKALGLVFKGGNQAHVLVDRASLHRILLNVFSNAIKFTASGTITVEVESDSHRVLLHVRDTGAGIDPAFVPHLFGAFRQGSSGHSREHEGSGLGLTITKRLIDLNGGRIRVHSEPGKGTCISMTFARAPGFPEQSVPDGDPDFVSLKDLPTHGDGGPAGHPHPTPAPLAARPRVLVVEDNLDTARLFERMLLDHFDVDRAENGKAALRHARRNWYDLLLIDIHLGPGPDGTQVLAELRDMSAYAHVPAVAVTTYTASGDRERFLAAGFDAYLPKPFTRKQLLGAAEQAHAARALAAA